MAEDRALPQSWARDFEGKLSARYRRDPVGVEVVIEPRYAVEDGRPEREPSAFRVQLRRPFWNRNSRIEMPLTIVESFDEAREVARRYMENYNENYRRIHDGNGVVRTRGGNRDRRRTASVVAVTAVGETTSYSDDLLFEHLESILRDGLRAVWHADPTGVDPVYVADHVELDEARIRELTDTVGSFDRDAVGDALRETVACITVSLETHALYQFVVDAGHSTFVLVDEARGAQLPNFTRETRALLAARLDE